MADGFEYPLLTRALRRLLRARKLLYRDVARELGLAESTIKRVLTARDGSVSRLADICRVAGVEFRDLVTYAHEEEEPVFRLTPEQEAFFLENVAYFRVFSELFIRKQTPAEVRAAHGLSARSMRRYLEKLEHLGLLEVTGKKEVRMRVRGALAFQPGSEFLRFLQQAFVRQLVEELTGEGGTREGDQLVTREWMAGQATLEGFSRELSEVVDRMEKSATRDEALLPRDQLIPVAWLGGRITGRLTGGRIPEIGVKKG